MLLIVLGAFVSVASKSFTRAMAQTGTSLKCAAISMGIDAAQLRRQLDGHEHLSARRVFDYMPHEFLQYFALNQVIELGFPVEVRMAALIQQHVEKAL